MGFDEKQSWWGRKIGYRLGSNFEISIFYQRRDEDSGRWEMSIEDIEIHPLLNRRIFNRQSLRSDY